MNVKRRTVFALAIILVAAILFTAYAASAALAAAGWVAVTKPLPGVTYDQVGFSATALVDSAATNCYWEIDGGNQTMTYDAIATNLTWTYVNGTLTGGAHTSRAYCDAVKSNWANFTIIDNSIANLYYPAPNSYVRWLDGAFNLTTSHGLLVGTCTIQYDGQATASMNSMNSTYNTTWSHTNTTLSSSTIGDTHYANATCTNTSNSLTFISNRVNFYVKDYWPVALGSFYTQNATQKGLTAGDPIYFNKTGQSIELSLQDKAYTLTGVVNGTARHTATATNYSYYTVNISKTWTPQQGLLNVTLFANTTSNQSKNQEQLVTQRWMVYDNTTPRFIATATTRGWNYSQTLGGGYYWYNFTETNPSTCGIGYQAVNSAGTILGSTTGTIGTISTTASAYNCTVTIGNTNGVTGESKIYGWVLDKAGNYNTSISTWNITNTTIVPLYTGANLVGVMETYSLLNFSYRSPYITDVAWYNNSIAGDNGGKNYTTYSVASGATGTNYDKTATYGMALWVTVSANTVVIMNISKDNTVTNISMTNPGWNTYAPQNWTNTLYTIGLESPSAILNNSLQATNYSAYRIVFVNRSLANPWVSYWVGHNTTNNESTQAVPRGYAIYIDINGTAANNALWWRITT